MSKFNCSTCKYLKLDSCLNGYCNNKDSKYYRQMMVNDYNEGIMCKDYETGVIKDE